jgi:DNA-binding PadR family transcriptional regulator
MSDANPSSFLPLTQPIFHILLALANGEKHGYAIMQEVELISNQQFKMGPATLYSSIKRMLEIGLIEESDDRPDPGLDDQRRRYYRLSGLGGRVLAAESRRLADLVARARARQVMPVGWVGEWANG